MSVLMDFNRFFICSSFIFFPLLFSIHAEEKEHSRSEIIAHLGELPGLINADGSGPFVDFVRRIDELDPDIKINIYVYPIHRALYGIINGSANFALPAIRTDDPEKNYRSALVVKHLDLSLMSSTLIRINHSPQNNCGVNQIIILLKLFLNICLLMCLAQVVLIVLY